MNRSLLIAIALIVLIAGIAQAHGLHAPVEPQYHALVHVLQFVGVAGAAIGLGVWAARRRRAR